LKGVYGDVVEMAFSADGMRFVTVSTDGSIVIWAAQK
jgi:WD40 repeat protein